jgi:hypothetical protein
MGKFIKKHVDLQLIPCYPWLSQKKFYSNGLETINNTEYRNQMVKTLVIGNVTHWNTF